MRLPTPSAELLNGQWELLYTTSDSILGKSKPFFLRPSGPIYQVIGESPAVLTALL